MKQPSPPQKVWKSLGENLIIAKGEKYLVDVGTVLNDTNDHPNAS